MKIAGFQKLSLVDFPNKMACVLFTEGCNYRCPFCHNSPLIEEVSGNYYTEEEIFEFLNKRKNILDAVVISGGEPTIQGDLKEFVKKLRKYNLLIKLDTNGSNPILLKELIDENLVDYVAMDIKNTLDKYFLTVGIDNVNTTNIKKSINILKNSSIDYEFRTTIAKEFHNLDDLINIKKMIGDSKFYIQNFRDNENVLYENLHDFSKEELKEIKNNIKDVIIRGFDIKEEE